jgi:glycosyltransferase involved in cell wall biosynthesis
MKVLLISDSSLEGGVGSFELNILNNINKDIHVEVLSLGKCIIKDKRIHYIDIKRNNLFNKLKYNKYVKGFLKKNKYDVIHINSSAFFYSFCIARIAKKCNINKVVVHSHSNPHINILKRIIISLIRPLYMKYVDVCLSVSKQANKSLFSDFNDNIKILSNGIDINKYKYNKSNRYEVRKKYNIDNKCVYSNIARISDEKNFDYLIDLFNEIHKLNPKSILLIIGDGPLRERIIEKIKLMNLEDSIILLGYKLNVDYLLSAIDVLIVPSKREGFGLSCLEATVNGAKVFASDVLDKKLIRKLGIKTFSLNEDKIKVAKRIINDKTKIKRETVYKSFYDTEYDINYMCSVLEEIYNK